MSSDSGTLLACVEEEIAREEEEKAHMEAEIHRKMVSLAKLRAQRNSLLPIFRLPPEVLGIIFILGARNCYESRFLVHAISSILSWVNVSYVCHHWRNVALDSPTLWTYHFNLPRRWAEELLRRSKQALLKISYVHPLSVHQLNHWWANPADGLLKHSGRIQDLCLNLPPTFLLHKLSLRTPRLGNLDIQFHMRPVQPLEITDGGIPTLRTLKLVHCPLSWYSFNLSRLNTLSLHHAPFHLGISEFLALLNSIQDLTTLDLKYILPSSRDFLSSGGLGSSPKVDLPRLTLLSVITPLSTVTALLTCINIPLKARLNLEPQFEPGSSIDDYAPISSFLAQRFGASEQSSLPVFRSLIMDAGYTVSLTFSTSDCDPCPPTQELGYNIPLRIALRGDEGDMEEENDLVPSEKHHILSDICRSLPLTNIQSLHVTEPHLPPPIWEEILGCLKGLQYMKLSLGLMPELSILALTAQERREHLVGVSTYDPNLDSDHLLVPNLEEVELYGIRFLPENEAPWWGGMNQQSFFNVLSTRKGLRDRLKMIGCEMG